MVCETMLNFKSRRILNVTAGYFFRSSTMCPDQFIQSIISSPLSVMKEQRNTSHSVVEEENKIFHFVNTSADDVFLKN